MNWAGAAAGAMKVRQRQRDELLEMLARRRAEHLQNEQLKLQQAAAARAEQELGLRRQGQEADEAYRRGQVARQARLDAIAEDDRQRGIRDETNAKGVRRMLVEGLQARTVTPEQAALMAAGEGVEGMGLDVLDPDRGHRQRIDLAELQHRQRMGQIAAQGANAERVAGLRASRGGRGVLSGDANRIAELDTSLDDLGVLRQTIAAPGESGATGTAAKLGAMVPNFVTEATGIGEDAKAKQAVIDRVKQVIGKALEGGVLRKEDEYKYTKILPTIGDVDSVVLAKLDGLESAIKDRRERMLEALTSAGFDTSGFTGQAVPENGGGDEVDALLEELLQGGQ